MKELMMNEDLADITLITEDKKQIKANINILSACSPLFKDILKKEKNSSPIIYLRGIQYSEMESIMQFIYLGETTLNRTRMDEFISVAKSLEIQELCNAKTEPNDESDVETSTRDLMASTEKFEGQTVKCDDMTKQAQKEGKISVECDQCHKTYYDKSTLRKHKYSVHEGVWYECDQCDHLSRDKSNLTKHIQSKHEGVRYACAQCDYQSKHKSTLTVHIQSKHEGVKYACELCDYQGCQKFHLKRHIQNNHKSIYMTALTN